MDDDIAVRRASSFAVTLPQETRALEWALDLLGPLGLRGLLLRVNGRPAAFSIFDRLNPTTAVVLFERALRSATGLYQVINRETARVIAAEVSRGSTARRTWEILGCARRSCRTSPRASR